LRFVRRARDLGFSVSEIGELLDLWRDRGRQSSEVKRFVRRHTARLRAKINQLEGMVRTLHAFADRCAGDDRPDCPMIELLEGSGDRPRRSHRRLDHDH
jgi:MerR family transcriptional regulator, gold-responsive activator of gol and ges genes